MGATNTSATGRRWTASELRKLPAAERDAILEAAAAAEYRTNAELTAFEVVDLVSADPRPAAPSA
jgi:hypothetical protein